MSELIESWLSSDLMNNPIVLAISTLISEDLAFVYGLFSVKSSSMNAIIFILFYSLGVIVGDILLYGVGVLSRKYSHLKLISIVLNFFPKEDKNIDFKSFGLFEEFLVFTRFIPGTRLPTYIYCGLKGYSLVSFILILLMSTLTYALLGVGLILLTDGIDLSNTSVWMKVLSVLCVSFITIGFFKFVLLCRNLKKRYKEIIRPLSILILRFRFLEFWPTFLFYIPFVPYFLFLLIKYKGFSSALSSNPAIRMSGFIGELKSDIDEIILKYNPQHYLKLKKIEAGKEIDSQIANFSFPMIAKPDSGMRGTGVSLVSNLDELETYAMKSQKDFVIQEYYKSLYEWGVFYYRVPGKEKGEIFSITDKGFPKVIGNGVDSVYKLILQDKYRRNRFNWIFSDLDINPHLIPQKDEEVILNVRGSHSKGCIFWDGQSLMQDSYIAPIRESLDKLPGFHIGRVDLRFKSFESLENGDFKLIEINGAGAESGNMYDPDMSILNTYKILIKQWNLIFKIGFLNKKQNKSRDSLFNFLKAILYYKKEG